MTHDHRALAVWLDITWAVLPPLAILSIVLGWAPVMQIALTTLSGAAVFGTRIVLAHRDRRSGPQHVPADRSRSAIRRSRA